MTNVPKPSTALVELFQHLMTYHLPLEEFGYEAIKTIEHEHSHIHYGNHFKYDDLYSCSITVPATWLFTTPSTAGQAVHWNFKMSSGYGGLIEMIEGPGLTASGTSSAVFLNNYRSNTATAGFSMMRTIGSLSTSGGTIVHTEIIGSQDVTGPAAAVGGAMDRGHELILKAGTQYGIRFTPFADSTKVALQCSFYLETIGSQG